MDTEKKILIDHFWSDTASDQEKQRLLKLLEANNADWMAVQEKEFYAPAEVLITKAQSEQVLARLHQQLHKTDKLKTGFRFTSWIKPVYWSAAAVLILLSAIAILIHESRPPIAAPVTSAVAIAKPEFITIKNTSDKVKAFELPDRSEVRLFANSTISYAPAFGRQQRDIHLAGFARFKVTKDTHSPFRVFANGYSTTALGTIFTVNTMEQDNLTVKLFEGKVVVKRESGKKAVAEKDIYLIPGNKITINTKDGRVALSSFTLPKDRNHKSDQLNIQKATGITFDKDSLPNVFNELETAYHVEIVYHTEELKGLSFTGRINYKESLSMTLNAICTLNDLSFTQDGNKLIISKKKP